MIRLKLQKLHYHMCYLFLGGYALKREKGGGGGGALSELFYLSIPSFILCRRIFLSFILFIWVFYLDIHV